MRRSLYLLLLLLLMPALGSAREAWRGWCEQGAKHVVTSGLTSTSTVQLSSGGCQVTVYITGGALATLYADNNGTVKANPFTADTNGQWIFFADNGTYDVTTSSATLGNVTYSDILLCDPAIVGSACGSSGGVSSINIYKNGTLVGTEPGVDFIEGTNVTIDPATDDPPTKVHLTLNSAEQVALAGTLVGIEPRINFIQGTGIALTVADNTGVSPPRIDVTVAAAVVQRHGLVFTIGDPGGSALTAASTTTDYLTVPFACTISAYNLVIDAGTITVKFWKVATGTAIPTSGNSINTSGVGISSGTAIHSATLSDFTTTTVTANDIVAMNVTAVATAKYVTGTLQCDQ